MSRVGKAIINVPAGVSVEFDGTFVKVTGPKGDVLTQEIKAPITVHVEGSTVNVKRGNDEQLSRSLHGLYNRLIQNMIEGVTKGFVKTLILNGVGYKAAMKGEDLVLNLGKSHSDTVAAEAGVKIKICTPAEVAALNLGKEGVGVVLQVSGCDSQKVGQFASKIRGFRPVEPYYMYGIRYSDEHIIRKETKKAKGGKGGKK